MEIQPRNSGDGSFVFRLLGQNGIASGYRIMEVKIIQVTLSMVSDEKQYGKVGETLPAPIVISLKNSNKEPVSGATIFWLSAEVGFPLLA